MTNTKVAANLNSHDRIVVDGQAERVLTVHALRTADDTAYAYTVTTYTGTFTFSPYDVLASA